MNNPYPLSPFQPGLREKTLAAFFIAILIWTALCTASTAQTFREPVEVRQVGLSRVGEQTLLTVMLNRQAAPLIAQKTVNGIPQMIIDFPRGRAGALPPQQFGDELLVKRVLTQVGPDGHGVQIIMEMDPQRPYTWWRRVQTLRSGQTAFIIGLKPEGAPRQAELLPAPPPQPAPQIEEREPEPEPAPAPAPEPEWSPPPSGPRPVGGFAELRHLIPQAEGLWRFLEKDGWSVLEAKNYDRPGKRFSRGFTLSNSRYPEAVINIAYIPANTPGAPDISVIDLDFERLNSPTAREYREMKKWDFGKIKTKYEDIGDFFDDALKPLRVKLRQECQTLALRWSSLIQDFVRHAAPRHPGAADEIMNHIKAKVNPRFEGVQFTISEKPLLILNLVDFLYIRAYYLGKNSGGGHD
ncbi:MAG: hypothetical protein QME75_07620 [Deltaproteobacteria bacterium]|nr:hypothetical protein [Deltaproteobacteria bacterium]